MSAPDTPRYGRRKITGMRAEWNALREAVRSGDAERTERVFDACEEWIDFAFGRGAEGAELRGPWFIGVDLASDPNPVTAETQYIRKELVDILEAALQAAIDGKDAQAAAFDALTIYRKAIGGHDAWLNAIADDRSTGPFVRVTLEEL